MIIRLTLKQKKESQSRDFYGDYDFFRYMRIIEECNRLTNEFARKKTKPTDDERIDLDRWKDEKKFYSSLIYG